MTAHAPDLPVKRTAYVEWATDCTDLALRTPLVLGRSRGMMSYEGVSLSVSVRPGWWAKFLTLRGPTYRLEKRDQSAFAFAVWSVETERVACAWAERESWLVVREAGVIEDPFVVDRQSVYETRRDFDYAAWVLGRNDRKIKARWGMRLAFATQKLVDRFANYFDGFEREEAIHPRFVRSEAMNLWLAAVRPDLDGIWSGARGHTRTREAERGALLPHALGRIHATACSPGRPDPLGHCACLGAGALPTDPASTSDVDA